MGAIWMATGMTLQLILVESGASITIHEAKGLPPSKLSYTNILQGKIV